MNALWITDSLSEEQMLLRRTTRQFVETEVVPRREAAAKDPRGAMPGILRASASVGLTALDIPERYGGLGLSRRDSALVVEEAVRDFSFGVTAGVHCGIGMWPILLFGTEAHRREFLPRIARAEIIAAYALTEPGAGSNAMGVTMRADPVDDGYALTGQKMWISNAGFADVFSAFARTPEGMTGFIVPRDSPGLSVGSEEHKMGIRGSSTAAVFFDGVRVPGDRALGERGRGHKIAFDVLNLGRLKLAAGSVGMARQAFEEAAAYARMRPQFQNRIGEFPAVREMIARMAVALYGAESITYRVADGLDQAERAAGDHEGMVRAVDEASLECSAAKVAASEALGRIVDDAVQIHGGIGFSEATEAARIYRDARVARIFEGTTQVNSLVVIERFIFRAAKGAFPLAGLQVATPANLADDLAERISPGAGRDERARLWAGFALCLGRALASAGGTKPFLWSVNNPDTQRLAWPLARMLVVLLELDAAAARAVDGGLAEIITREIFGNASWTILRIGGEYLAELGSPHLHAFRNLVSAEPAGSLRRREEIAAHFLSL